MKKLQTRKDKINFLKGVANGKNSPAELVNKEWETWREYNHGNYEGPIKYEGPDGTILTNEELKDRMNRLRDSKRFITVKYASKIDPLIPGNLTFNLKRPISDD